VTPEHDSFAAWAPAGAAWRVLAFLLDLLGFCLLSSPLLLYCYGQAFSNRMQEGSSAYWMI
jgi:hypothetical protein